MTNLKSFLPFLPPGGSIECAMSLISYISRLQNVAGFSEILLVSVDSIHRPFLFNICSGVLTMKNIFMDKFQKRRDS